MTQHEALDDDAREQVALSALGALPAAEAQAMQAHLAECAPCREELAALQPVIEHLQMAVPEVPPPESLWRRLQAAMHAAPHEPPPGGAPRDAVNGHALRGINGTVRPADADADAGTQTWKRWSDDRAAGLAAHFAYVPADGHPWEPTAVPGIEARRLFVDEAQDRVTMLVRMAAGCAYPAHRHANAEECFVLHGDLHAGDVHMHAGDYQRAEVGSTHPVQVTDGGCVLLLVSSLHDELLDR